MHGLVQPAPEERRTRPDRRRRIWWSIVYGSFNPRRRRPPRRGDESRFHTLDWHGAHLLAVSISILIFSIADAFLTLELISAGAMEINPLMATFISGDVTVFAELKMAMTGLSVLLMVLLSRYRFMRLVRVEILLYGALLAYVSLIGYEVWMLQGVTDRQIL